MTLNEYLRHLGWNLQMFSEYADINVHTARRAVREGIVSARVAVKIAAALSKHMGQDIKPGMIEGLLIRN